MLGFGLDELRKPARDLLALIESKVGELGEDRGVAPTSIAFQRRDVRAWSGLPNHQVKQAMRELEELEYVEVERAARGSRFTYRLAQESGHKRAPLRGLLTPVELFNRMQEEAKPERQRTRPRRQAAKVEQSGRRRRSTHSRAQS